MKTNTWQHNNGKWSGRDKDTEGIMKGGIPWRSGVCMPEKKIRRRGGLGWVEGGGVFYDADIDAMQGRMVR
jgi:hypothetical protein